MGIELVIEFCDIGFPTQWGGSIEPEAGRVVSVADSLVVGMGILLEQREHSGVFAQTRGIELLHLGGRQCRDPAGSGGVSENSLAECVVRDRAQSGRVARILPAFEIQEIEQLILFDRSAQGCAIDIAI